MFNIIIGLVVLLALIILDKQVNFQNDKKLKILYLAINVFIFGLFQYYYAQLVLNNSNFQDLFFNIKNTYYLGMAALFIVLFVLETIKSKNIKTSYIPLLTGLVFIGLSRVGLYIVAVLPLVLGIFLVKSLVSLFYPNIKLNYILANKYHLEEGYENLPIKTIFQKLFYRGDFFELDILNNIYTFYTSSYLLKAKRQALIYGSENIDDQFNLMTIVEHYEREEEGYVVFNNIEMSINNRYEETDVFKLDKITEIADGEFFKNYLASQILDYPRVDFEYRIYVADLSVFKVGENFRLFDVNKEEIKRNKIVKQYEIKMDNLKDDDKISNYLNKLIEKELIYNQIEGYLNKGYEDSYRFDRTKSFSLKYDAGIRCFKVYSEELGLIGRLNTDETDKITKINLPVYDNIVFEQEENLEEDIQKYGLFAKTEGEEKPYDLYIKFFVEVDFTKLEELKKPEFNLIGKFDLELSL